MAMIECPCCQETCEARSMTPCRGCGKMLCPSCAGVEDGLCVDCACERAAREN